MTVETFEKEFNDLFPELEKVIESGKLIRDNPKTSFDKSECYGDFIWLPMVRRHCLSKQRVREAIKAMWSHHGELAQKFNELGLFERKMDAIATKVKCIELIRELGLDEQEARQ